MVRFQEIKTKQLHSIIFLCGTNYRRDSKNDKRNVLRDYIEEKFPDKKAIILEEHFVFGKSSKYLSYDEIFMKNLCDIEELSAAFADGIIIIHDSISTAAELAAFASNPLLQNKICVLEPDSTGLEEQKISSFLELAFFHEKSEITRIPYYPEVYAHHISKNHIEKHSIFFENSITPVLSGKIDQFLGRCGKTVSVEFEKMLYGKPRSDPGVISYRFEGKELYVHLSGKILLYQVIVMVGRKEIKEELERERRLNEHVTLLTKRYREILRDTIQGLEREEAKDIHIRVRENHSSERDVIAYSLYMMQALKLLEFQREEDDSDCSSYRIRTKSGIREYWKNLKGLVSEEADMLAELVDE